jgi:hypothetical protein
VFVELLAGEHFLGLLPPPKPEGAPGTVVPTEHSGAAEDTGESGEIDTTQGPPSGT